MTNLPAARPPIRPLASTKETCRGTPLSEGEGPGVRSRANLCILTTLLILAYFITRIIGRM